MGKWIDSSGTEYKTLKEMCEAHGISVLTVQNRRRNGWTLTEAVEHGLCSGGRKDKVKDHLGNEYSSVASMCKAYGIGRSTFENRIKRGHWTLEKALTTPLLSKLVCNGREYRSRRDMCVKMNISLDTVNQRLKRGMSIEDAVSVPIKKVSKECVDHTGGTFKSLREMAKFYKISCNTIIDRLNKGWDMEKTLTTLPKEISCECTGLNGEAFVSVRKMCEHYGIKRSKFENRTRYGWNTKNALRIPCEFSLRKIPVDYRSMSISYVTCSSNGEPFFKVKCNVCGEEDVLSYDEINEHADKCEGR